MKKEIKKEIDKPEQPEPENTRPFHSEDKGYQEEVFNKEEEKAYEKSDNAEERDESKT